MSLTLQEALAIVDDGLSDGAWMQTICDLTGLDAGDVSDGLMRLQERERDSPQERRRQENIE
jgi:hypothetical protein